MGKIGIIADTACDLTNELCEKHNIERIPFYVNVNGKEYLSGRDITVEELFKFSRENKSIPKTSQITIVEFTNKFNKMIQIKQLTRCLELSLPTEVSIYYAF